MIYIICSYILLTLERMWAVDPLIISINDPVDNLLVHLMLISRQDHGHDVSGHR
jgi:hypothetical protein